MIKNINKAVVFGAGVMGASIAGLLASVGVETVLLDIVPPQGLTDEEKAKGLTEDSYEFRNRFSLAGLDRIKKPRNNMTLSKGAVKNVRIGNTTDNLDEIDDADWIVEAVSERIDIKQSVLKQIAPHRKPDAIVSSNTSTCLMKEYSASDDPVMLSGWQFFVGGLMLVALAAVTGGSIHPDSPSAYAMMLYLAALSAVAYTIWSIILKYNPVSRIAMCKFMVPVFGVILSAMLLGEPLTLMCAAALILVSLSIIITNKQ